MYEFFDHTADLGIRATASTWEGLFAAMAEGLTAAIIENPEAIREVQSHSFEIANESREDLLFDWLRQVLYLFDVDGWLFHRFEIQKLDQDGLQAIGWGETYDPQRHLPNHEVKAVTYHGLEFSEIEGQLQAEVIVDI